jgi:hypothetical protein
MTKGDAVKKEHPDVLYSNRNQRFRRKRDQISIYYCFFTFFLFYCYESEIFNCKIKDSGNRTVLRNDPEPHGSTVQFPDARTNLLSVVHKSTPSL